MNSDIAQTREMRIEDLHQVVSIHTRSFEGFFLTFLGNDFLYELYAGTLSDSSGIVYVYENEDAILGFVAGTAQPSGFYRRLILKRWWRFGLASIKPFLRNPSVLPRLLRALLKPSESADGENCGELMSLAVLPDYQGRGIGQALVQAFLQETSRCGVCKVNLTTDRDGNEGVNVFYQKLGFTCSRTFTTLEGRIMNEYSITL